MPTDDSTRLTPEELKVKRLQRIARKAIEDGKFDHLGNEKIPEAPPTAGLPSETKNGLIGILVVVSWFIPLVWPVTIAIVWAMYPRSGKKLAIGAGGLAVVFLLISTSFNRQGSEIKKEAPNEVDYTKGEKIYSRLRSKVCDELDLCWITEGFSPEGSRILRKEFPIMWGNEKTVILPIEEWNSLSAEEKSDFTDYLRSIHVKEVIVGSIRPSPLNPSRMTVGVDKPVWSER
ncbi:hypothetical protein [Synechococcus sp. CBW1107]|uniref:hypothetical protein n=1 Tax=Synechococcus sp. CBW1107 TaxID=2789857 RepID=UPI002AD221AD|nr:hypothetical protein [Synechococcus sp. CBW1107]CAK6700997.1 hypothetical protein IFHNHDMJ_02978 [Synechococcus sp. CBW1107]